MEYERPSPKQIQSSRIERLALSLANGGTRGRVETAISREIPSREERAEVLRLTLQRARVLINQQKKRYVMFGAIWLLLGLVPLIAGLIFSGGSLLILTGGPIAYGIYLMTRKGNAPSDFDEMD